MTKLLFICCVLLVGAVAYCQTSLSTSSPTFTVRMRNGKTFKATDCLYGPTYGLEQYDDDVSLHNEIGYVSVNKRLEDIKSIEVLDDSGALLKVTYLSHDVFLGQRRPEFPYKTLSDRLTGESGRLIFGIDVKELLSIERD
jgi:hypothetical protein